MGTRPAPAEHAQSDDEQNDPSGHPEVVHIDAEEAQERCAGHRHHCAHDRTEDNGAPGGPALLGGLLTGRQAQEQGQVDERIHDGEERPECLDEQGCIHVQIHVQHHALRTPGSVG